MKPKRIVAWPALGLAAACLMALAPQALSQANPPPDTPPTVVTRDAFGEEITFPPRTVLYRKGEASWEEGWAKLTEVFKELRGAADGLGLKVTGLPLVIYRGTDDEGFKYEAALPVETAAREAPGGGLATGPGPVGKAIKFVHRGSFDTLDTSYELIANFLDSKRIETEQLSIEEYVSDPVTTQPDDLVVNIYMLLKKQ